MIRVSRRSAPLRLAFSMIVAKRLAPRRSAFDRLARRRVVPSRLAFLRSAPSSTASVRSQLKKSEPASFAPVNFVPVRLARLKSMPSSTRPLRSAPAKLAGAASVDCARRSATCATVRRGAWAVAALVRTRSAAAVAVPRMECLSRPPSRRAGLRPPCRRREASGRRRCSGSCPFRGPAGTTTACPCPAVPGTPP